MSTRAKIWSGLLLTLILVIGVLIAVWDWNWFKPIIEAKLSQGTGQDIKINGDLNVRLSGTPEIEAQQIVITNPHWKGPDGDKKLATIDDFLISIDLGQLLRGHLSFPEIIVTKPDLTLRRVALGEANWTPPDNPDKPTKRASLPEIGKLQVKDGILDYQDSVKNLNLKGKISTIEGSGGQGGDTSTGFTLDGNGTLQNGPLILKIKSGPLFDLANTSKPYPVNIDLTLEKTHLKLDGAVTDPTKLSGLDATLELEGPSAGDLFPVLNIPAPETPPYHIKGHLVHHETTWTYENFAGVVGSSDLNGTVDVDTSKPKLFVKANLASKKLDFHDVGPLIGIPSVQKPETDQQKKAAEAYKADARLLPDAKLSLGKVRSVDADLRWKVASVLAPKLPLENVDLHIALNNGILDIDPLDLGVAGGKIDSRIKINAQQDTVQTDYDIRFHDFQLSEFMGKGGLAGKGSGRIGGRVQLHAPGNSVRESLGSSNGTVGLLMNKGEISDLAVALVGIDIGEAMKVELTSDKLIPIRCIATSFNVDNGLMKPQVFVIDTNSTLVTGSGSINLKNEGLDLKLTAAQKSPSLLAAPTPIDIDGTFKRPEFGLDTVALVERGAAAVALGIVLTPLGSLLAFVDPGTAENADCANLLTEVKDAPAEHPSGAPAPQPAPKN